jgi:hypothetical protein
MSADKLYAALANLLKHVDRGSIALPPTRSECAYLARAILATLGPRLDPSLADHMRKWFFTLGADVQHFGPEHCAAAFVERHCAEQTEPSEFDCDYCEDTRHVLSSGPHAGLMVCPHCRPRSVS